MNEFAYVRRSDVDVIWRQAKGVGDHEPNSVAANAILSIAQIHDYEFEIVPREDMKNVLAVVTSKQNYAAGSSVEESVRRLSLDLSRDIPNRDSQTTAQAEQAIPSPPGKALFVDYKRAKEDAAGHIAKAKEVLKDAFRERITSLFEENSELKSIRFHNYTPYFNDGDECVFRTGYDYCDINEDEEGSDFPELQKKVIEVLSDFADEDYKYMFGDHVQISISKDLFGVHIDTSDYDHE